jgi:hypothetical protein
MDPASLGSVLITLAGEWFCISNLIFMINSQVVQGTRHRLQVLSHDVGVGFRRFDIRMAHQFLNDSYVDAILQQVSGVTVAKCMTGDTLAQSRPADSGTDGLLKSRRQDMVTMRLAATWIYTEFFLREKNIANPNHTPPDLFS